MGTLPELGTFEKVKGKDHELNSLLIKTRFDKVKTKY